MNLNAIQAEIKKCNEDPFLTSEQKKIRLKILQAAIQKVEMEKKNNQLTTEYQKQVADFFKATSGRVELSFNIENNEDILKKYILSSEVFRDNPQKDKLSLDALKLEIWDYSYNHNKELRDLKVAVMICEVIEEMRKNEKDKASAMATNFIDIVGPKIMDRNKKLIKLENDEVTVTDKKKSKEEYDSCRIIAKRKMTELYESPKIIDKTILNYAILILDDIFDNYTSEVQGIEILQNTRNRVGRRK